MFFSDAFFGTYSTILIYSSETSASELWPKKAHCHSFRAVGGKKKKQNKNAQYGTGTHKATIIVRVLIRYFSGVASLLSKQTTTDEHKFIINPVYVELHNLETNFRRVVVHLRPLLVRYTSFDSPTFHTSI